MTSPIPRVGEAVALDDLIERAQATLDHAKATGENPTSQRALEYLLGLVLDFLRRPSMGERAVKALPLEWSEPDRRGDEHADSILGRYACGLVGKTFSALLLTIKDGQDFDYQIGRYGSMDEAKAAAQSDFTSRINSALSQTTLEPERGWRTMDSAPKDGWLLGIVAGEYRPGVPFVPMSVRWHAGWGGFLDAARWNAYETQDEDRGWEGMREPTHWQPLPAPPESPKS